MDVIEVEGVSFDYRSGERVTRGVRGLTFGVREGEFLAVLGRNGSGKSTLAKLLNGFLVPDEGEIRVKGVSTREEEQTFFVRSSVGLVFQNPDNQMVASIIEDDLAFGPENLGVPPEEIRARVDFALEAVGMSDYRFGTPDHLSGGQKQRVSIAAVLAMKPSVLVLDEATAMLDPAGRAEVLAVARKLNREEGMTVILITHYVDEAVQADRCAVLSEGELIALDTPRELFRNPAVLRRGGLELPVPALVHSLLDLPAPLPLTDREFLDALLASLSPVLISDSDSPTDSASDSASDSIGDSERKGETLLKGEGIGYVYSEKTPYRHVALEGVDLEIRKGETLGIIGTTGSGKSTLIRHFNGLVRVQSGKLVVLGEDMTKRKPALSKVRAAVGMLFQYPEYQLFADTVLKDVAFGPKNFGFSEEEANAAALEALRRVGLDPEEVKDKSPFELSGGQRRRVALAGVIASRPRILVLDEPTAGLDPVGKREILELIAAMKEGGELDAVVTVSHNMDEIAAYCSRILVLHDALPLAYGDAEAVFSALDLEGTGLALPHTVALANELKKHGFSFPHLPLTPLSLASRLKLYRKISQKSTLKVASATEEGGY